MTVAEEAESFSVYHRTNAASAIMRDGFRDATGYYLTSVEATGVWVSDVPVDCNEGAKGDDLLEVVIPEAVLADYEWVDDLGTYREWCVPAALLNNYPRRLLTDEQQDEATARGWAFRAQRADDLDGPLD